MWSQLTCHAQTEAATAKAMPNPYFPCASVAVAGTGSAANLVASSAGQGIRVWQLIASGTANDTVSLSFTVAGVATTAKIGLLANTSAILPMTGVPWAQADTGTAVQFTAASTTTVTAYYSKGIVLLCYKKGAPQKGQPESCRSRTLAMVCRRVAMDQGLCRSTRTGRTPRTEPAWHFGDG